MSELGGRVRRIDAADGTVTTVATGLDQPHGLVVDADGTLVVCETFADRLVRIDPSTGRPAPLPAEVRRPVDIARSPSGTLFVADADGISRIGPGGERVPVAPARRPQSVAVDGAGVVYFTELSRAAVRRIDPATGAVTTVLGR